MDHPRINNNKVLVLYKEYAQTQLLEFVVAVVLLDGGDGVIVHFEDTGPEQPEEIIACSVRILGGHSFILNLIIFLYESP